MVADCENPERMALLATLLAMIDRLGLHQRRQEVSRSDLLSVRIITCALGPRVQNARYVRRRAGAVAPQTSAAATGDQSERNASHVCAATASVRCDYF